MLAYSLSGIKETFHWILELNGSLWFTLKTDIELDKDKIPQTAFTPPRGGSLWCFKDSPTFLLSFNGEDYM